MPLLVFTKWGGPVTPPPPPPPPPVDYPGAGDRLAAYKIEVAWSHNIPGVAVLDLSTLGGADTLGGAGTYVMEQFGGPYDDITARSDNRVRVEQISWTRGRSDDFSQMQAMSATISGRDPDGMMNIHNPASPLNQGSLVNGDLVPLRPVRVTGTFNGIDYPVLFGFIRSIDFEPLGRTGTFSLEVTDLFAMLETPRKDQPNSTAKPVIPYTTGITTGTAIGMVLDTINWTDPALRSLDPGDLLPFFEATGEASALDLISQLVAASLGQFYISSSGVATYVDRNSRFANPVRGDFRDTMSALGSGVSLDTIKNNWTVTKQNRTSAGQYTDSLPQAAADFDSANQYGDRADSFSSPWILDDAVSLQLSQHLLEATKKPTNPVWRLQVENREAELTAQMLTLDLADRVAASEAETGTTGIFFIEQIAGQITAQGHKHTVSYILSDRSAVALATLDPFILGTDVLDGPKVLGF